MSFKRTVKKAIFPVAGFGTRFLPATKAMPKELLPVIDKPLIQYAAEEAVRAGIDTLIFVTGRNKRGIEDHFDRNEELENALISKGKNDQAEMIKRILPEGVECVFVRQPKQLGLGHAVLCAERVVGNEPFAVLLADDFLVSDGLGETSRLVKKFVETGFPQLSVMEVEKEETKKYGIITPGKENVIKGLIEKPNPISAPSNLASIGRYVLTPDIFSIIKKQAPGSGGEVQLSDAINIQAQIEKVQYSILTENRFDCGAVNGYLKAIIHVAEKNKFEL